MWDFVKSIITSVVPPRIPDPDQTYRWGVTVATLLIAIGGLTLANTLTMFGFVPALFAGLVPANSQTVSEIAKAQTDFARKADLAAISGQIASFANALITSQLATLDQQIYNLRVTQCNALKAGNREAAQSHGVQLQGLQAQFRNLAHYDYVLRPCAEL